MNSHPYLFAPFRLGPLALPNRFVMAPMTRGRAMADGTPTPRMASYYGMRAAAGLLVTEATAIANGGYDATAAEAALAGGDADLVAFGVPFLCNPDLVKRVRLGAAMNPPDFATLYTDGDQGYLDYPTLAGHRPR